MLAKLKKAKYSFLSWEHCLFYSFSSCRRESRKKLTVKTTWKLLCPSWNNFFSDLWSSRSAFTHVLWSCCKLCKPSLAWVMTRYFTQMTKILFQVRNHKYTHFITSKDIQVYLPLHSIDLPLGHWSALYTSDPKSTSHRLCVMWTDGTVVEFGLCILWLLVRSPVVELTVCTADET